MLRVQGRTNTTARLLAVGLLLTLWAVSQEDGLRFKAEAFGCCVRVLDLIADSAVVHVHLQCD